MLDKSGDLYFPGHRTNPVGYAKEIEKFDVGLGNLLEVLKKMIY